MLGLKLPSPLVNSHRWRIPVSPTMKASLLYTMLSAPGIQRLSSSLFSLVSTSMLLTVMAGKFKFTADMVDEFIIPLLSSENYISLNVLIVNVGDKLRE